LDVFENSSTGRNGAFGLSVLERISCMARIILQGPPKAQLQRSGIPEDALPIIREYPRAPFLEFWGISSILTFLNENNKRFLPLL
jgi:hypothetical protein